MQTLSLSWRSCGNVSRWLPIAFIFLYQRTLSPLFIALGFGCRFYPSCSEYALTNIRLNGVIKSSRPILKRLSRCHPWCSGGPDPVVFNGVEYFSSRKLRHPHG